MKRAVFVATRDDDAVKDEEQRRASNARAENSMMNYCLV